jgi:hypothetical protein
MRSRFFFGLVVAVLTGCTMAATPPTRTSTESPAPPPASEPRVAAPDGPPRWQAGDRWVYELSSSGQTVTRTIDVADVETVNGVKYYVANIGDVQMYFTTELHWAATMRNSKVQERMVPPQPLYVWPLQVGRRWTHRGTFEESQGHHEQIHRFVVSGVETVEVPAGRFQAFKILHESGDKEADQYWYAPEVGSHVRWVGRRGDIDFEERLKTYSFAARPNNARWPTNRSSLR